MNGGLLMWIRMTMWLICWPSHWVAPSKSSLFEWFFSTYTLKRGWTFRRGVSHSCCPQEREPCPLTCEWVLRELELWASVTSILFFLFSWLLIEQTNVVYFWVGTALAWGECFGAVLAVCVTRCYQMLQDSYLTLCVLWDQMYQMRRVPEV